MANKKSVEYRAGFKLGRALGLNGESIPYTSEDSDTYIEGLMDGYWSGKNLHGIRYVKAVA